MRCDVCFRKCDIAPGGTGACKARGNDGQKIVPLNYGRITSCALDPIEKKPLSDFHPGSLVLSLGSYGCDLFCPFCQNVEISLSDGRRVPDSQYLSPEDAVDIALKYRSAGNIGIAFTYNEPLVGWEYVRDTARLSHENGMLNVLVTNGSASIKVLDEVGPYIDAMNIDLKSFSPDYYKNVLKGDLDATMDFIRRALKYSHIELTTLIVPGDNDSDEEIASLAEWVASLERDTGRVITLHITRFFPRSAYSDREPTEVGKIYRLADIARKKLSRVIGGNV